MSAEAFASISLRAPRWYNGLRRLAGEVTLPIGFILICIAAFEILARTFDIPEVLLPPPSRVATALVANAPTLGYHALLTILQVLVALVVSLAVGVLIATIFTLSRVIEDMFAPMFVALQIVPKIA